MSTVKRFAIILVAWALAAGASVVSQLAVAGPVTDGAASPEAHATDPKAASERRHLKKLSRPQVGKASIYASSTAGKTMANGMPMRLASNTAASKTLPLGTTARVTDLDTGRSAVVTIRDRGPYVKGRIVDLSPATAHRIGLEPEQGIARVVVKPIAIPKPDGSVVTLPSNDAH